jgi:hypothetical protein
MGGFARNLTPSLFELSVDLTDTKDDYQHHSFAMAEWQREFFETNVRAYPCSWA